MKLSLLHEVVMKYSNTYIQLQVNSNAPKRVFLLQNFLYDQDEGETIPRLNNCLDLSVRGCFIDKGEQLGDCELNLNEYIMDLSVPEDGYKNTDNGAIYYSVEPNKQYKKTICNNRMDVSSSMYLDYLFVDTYMSVTEAVENVLSRVVTSAAIAQHYAVGRYLKSKAVFLFYKESVIGVINNDDLGEYYVVLPAERKYLVEDVEQYIECEVRE